MRWIRPLLALAVALSLSTAARAEDWDNLGSRRVHFVGDHDTIDCRGEGSFDAIKLDVDDGNLEMYNIRITFRNGETHSPDTRITFDRNSRSRTIDLPGEAGNIQKVEFWYKSKLNRGHATLTLYGRRAAAGPGRDPEPAVEGQWELLGIRLVDFGAEKDVIEVTATEGRFNAIRFEVEEGNLDLYNVRVDFGNDEHFSPDTRYEFREGSRSRSIDLPGEARVIQKVTFWYRSELKKGKARLRLYGRPAGGGGGGKVEPAKERWEKLGSRQVDFVADKDSIEVGAVEGRFNAVRIDVDDGNIDMWNIRIEFGNDEHHSPDTRIEFNKNSRSRVIDLPGDARVIRKISFWYKSEFKKGRATVHVFGRHAAGGGDVKPVDPPRKAPKDRFPGWDHLGSRVVDFGGDKDSIDCRGEGRFSAFQIEVEDGDLEMFDVTVHFMNGEQTSPNVRALFEGNSRTRVIDLPGKERAVKRIEFKYKSIRATRDGKATINLYGKK
ncbi:MAG: hypothetical protein HUU15_05130 [Candidatus Brocadiae bacterium]|nr:hypothetical protein [Candidatus Brocadiia bacterium]